MKVIRRRYKSQKKPQKIKGGNNIPNYGLNSYNEDPQYMQISTRNILQKGSGKRKTKKYKKKSIIKKGGGSFFDFAANQSSNSISNFPNNSNNILFGNNVQNSAAYVQHIGEKNYTGELIK
jgi:hypothetical protein